MFSRSKQATGQPRDRDALELDFALSAPPRDSGHDGQPKRDWKKVVLVAGLGILSWVATYIGMLELIEANMGELPLVHKLVTGFSVAMLMTMIIWLLDQLFAPIGLFTKTLYAAGYLFLSIISVGFGFGFYWKVLESKSEATRGAESAITQVQGSLYAASTRLEQLQGTLVQLTAISTQKAEVERTQGTSCPNSKPGDGPRRKLRDDDAARFSFASQFVKGRVGQVKGDMGALDVDLAKIVKDDKSIIDAKSGTRNDFMRAVGRKLDMTVTGFNAFRTDPQLKQIRADLADRAEKTTFLDTRGQQYSCPDAQLQTALRGVVRAIDQLPELQKPQVAAIEGSEATIEAFRRLTATFIGALSFKMPPSAEELRDLQKKAVQSVETAAPARATSSEQPGLSKRDYLPLAVAMFVDICLLLVSMGRPMNRFAAARERMREAEDGPIFPIISKFHDIHADEDTRRHFEIFREVIFDWNGRYYVAVPLNAPRNHPLRAELLREGQALANLCYALEGQGVLIRPWSFVANGMALRSLTRQGSKFVECYNPEVRNKDGKLVRKNLGKPAFRVYQFKSGAWPEMILGAVMGAAKSSEHQRRRRDRAALAHRIEPTFAAPARASALATEDVSFPRPAPSMDFAPSRANPPEYKPEPIQPAPKTPAATAGDAIRATLSRAPQPATRADEVPPLAVRAANSNTLPVQDMVPQQSPIPIATDKVVPLPVRTEPVIATPAIPVTVLVETPSASAAADPVVEIERTRETVRLSGRANGGLMAGLASGLAAARTAILDSTWQAAEPAPAKKEISADVVEGPAAAIAPPSPDRDARPAPADVSDAPVELPASHRWQAMLAQELEGRGERTTTPWNDQFDDHRSLDLPKVVSDMGRRG